MDTSAPAYPATAYVLASDYDQLRQRLAEADTVAVDTALALHEAVQNARRQAGKAEAYSVENNELRAKLALAEQCSEYSDHEKSEAAGALSDRIDAAIDASGEGQ